MKLLILFLYLFYTVNSLYEDQAGKFDWYQQYFGKIDKLYVEKHNSHGRRLIISSNGNVHAALNLGSGNIEWRQHLKEEEKVLSLDYCKNNLVTVTVMPDSSLLRVWDTSLGVILWENQISETKVLVSSVKCNYDKGNVLVHVENSIQSYNLKSGGLNWKNQINTDTASIQESKLYSSKINDNVFLSLKSNKKSTFYFFNISGIEINLPNNNEMSHMIKCHYATFNDVFYCLDLLKFQLFYINLLGNTLEWKSFELNVESIVSSNRIVDSISVQSPDLLNLIIKDNNNDINPFTSNIFNIPPEDSNLNKISILYKVENNRILLPLTLDGHNYLVALSYFNDKKQYNCEIKFIDLADGREIKYLTNQYLFAKHHGKPEKMDVLLFKKKDTTLAYRIIFVTQDNAVHFLNQNGKVFWMREESLANVVAVEMLDLPVSDTEAKMDEEFGHSNDNILQKFIKRITTQLKQLKYFLQEQIKQSKSVTNYNKDRTCDGDEYDCKADNDAFNYADSSPTVMNSDSADANSTESQYNIGTTLRRDSFNVHKMLVLATTSGKIFGMESSTGRIVWRYLIDDACPFNRDRVQLFILRTTAHFPHPPEAVLLMNSTKSRYPILHTFNPITGLPQGRTKQLNYRIFLATMLSLPVMEVNDYSKPVLILDRDLKVHIYPPSFQLSLESHPIYLYRVDDSTGYIVGYEVRQHKSEDCSLNIQQSQPATNNLDEHPNCYVAHESWRMYFGADNQKISTIAFKSPIEQVHSVGRILPDRNVLYKYLNPNLLAVITESENINQNAVVTIYLIDVVTGKIIYSTIHRRASGPVNMIQSENWIVYSFQNLKSHRTEIAVLELYEPYEIPESALQEIKDVDISQLRRSMKSSRNDVGSGFDILSILGGERATTKKFSSKQRSRIDPRDGDLITGPIVLKQGYIMGTFIRKAAVSMTEKGITSKSVLLALETGGVLDLPKALLDPRRSLMMSQELLEEGVEPYMPEIPIRSFSIINYNRTVSNTRGIYAGPSGLESTSLVFIYGLDLFFTQIAPSKMYDVLKEDFDYVFIGTVTIGMIVGAFVTQKLAARRALYRAWQ